MRVNSRSNPGQRCVSKLVLYTPLFSIELLIILTDIWGLYEIHISSWHTQYLIKIKDSWQEFNIYFQKNCFPIKIMALEKLHESKPISRSNLKDVALLVISPSISSKWQKYTPLIELVVLTGLIYIFLM